MNIQNIKPQQNNTDKKPGGNHECTESDSNKTGLDQWNDRLDQNLETEKEGDELADENARDYSEKQGSGDQSDAP